MRYHKIYGGLTGVARWGEFFMTMYLGCNQSLIGKFKYRIYSHYLIQPERQRSVKQTRCKPQTPVHPHTPVSWLDLFPFALAPHIRHSHPPRKP